MRIIFLAVAVLYFSFAHAQSTKCRFDVRFTAAFFQENSVTLKWSINPTPQSGIIKIYRKEGKLESLFSVSQNVPFNIREFADGKDIKKVGYEYRLELHANKQVCSTKRRVIPFAIEDSSSVSTIHNGKSINQFKRNDFFEVIPESNSITEEGNLKIDLKPKKPNQAPQTDLQFYLIYNITLEGVYNAFEPSNLNKHTIYVGMKPSNAENFRIVVIKDDVIMGISPIVTFK